MSYQHWHVSTMNSTRGIRFIVRRYVKADYKEPHTRILARDECGGVYAYETREAAQALADELNNERGIA